MNGKREGMRAFMMRMFCLLLLCGLIWGAGAAEEAAAAEKAQWTVLFYFCGSDLESQNSFCSENLKEISHVEFPDSRLGEGYRKNTEEGWVNVLIETGGCRKWHAENLGMNISTDALQRWQLPILSKFDPEYERYGDPFKLLETLPLQNMSDPETLKDFIRWGVETCPAEKYALVLWDHGGGSKTGLFIDELFGNDWMTLPELGSAMKEAGTQFEMVLIDACMMANLETARAIGDSAKWLVASEEVVPGSGTAVGAWLQELVNRPAMDGKELGRVICDNNLTKYANRSERQSRSILTWSVIDQSKIPAVCESFDKFFETFGKIYREDPGSSIYYPWLFWKGEYYGDRNQKMVDLASIYKNQDSILYTDNDLRERMLHSISDAVVYSIRGAGRSGAIGLSICYPAGCSDADLDNYAVNSFSDHYLAFLDAISTWEAPEQIYENMGKLPELDEQEEFDMTVVYRKAEDGLPGIEVLSNSIYEVNYMMYRTDEQTGQVVRMGKSPCAEYSESDCLIEVARKPWEWPSIQGEICEMDMLGLDFTTSLTSDNRVKSSLLYNIPVLIDSSVHFLRCGRTLSYDYDYYGEDRSNTDVVMDDFVIYGIWEGYDENTNVLNRNVRDLAGLAGIEFKLLWDTGEKDQKGNSMYLPGKTITMYRNLDIEITTIPPGTYFLEYEIVDAFNRRFVTERAKVEWDGTKMTLAKDSVWEGEKHFMTKDAIKD